MHKMGCCYSATIDLKLVHRNQFVGLPVCWSGLANVTGEVNLVKTSKNSSTLQDSAGNVLLNIEVKDKLVFYRDPKTGNMVALLFLQQMGNFFSQKPCIWNMWTAEPYITGAQSESTPIGVAMYRLGSFIMKMNGKPLEFIDTSNESRLSIKVKSGSAGVVYGPDRVSAAAVVEKIRYPWYTTGKCTVAKGVDPILSFAMAICALSISGG